MEHIDLLYSGLMFAAGMLSLWTALLATVTFITLGSSLRKSESRAATISSTIRDGAEKSPSAASLSKALPQRPVLGRAVRLIQ